MGILSQLVMIFNAFVQILGILYLDESGCFDFTVYKVADRL